MTKNNGFSLIELVIVIAIMAIATSIGTISFNAWQTKYKVEAQTREIFNDLNQARANAFQQKKAHRVIFLPGSYVMKSYSSESEARNSGRTLISKPALTFGLTKKSGSSLTDAVNDSVEYDTRGFANDNFTLIVNPYTAGSVVNCIVISATRVNLGKINGTTCEFR
ncbi:MAG: type II secretion system protein [Desulfuromonadaceae bacterium]|nr:type II secretion system protein [Desulfuromonadaceae bacterium]